MALLGGLVRGLAGFGSSLVIVPLLVLLLAPRTVVPVAVLLELLASAWLLPQTWRLVRWRPVAILALGGVAGAPLGVALLRVASAGAMKLGIGLASLACCLLLARGWRLRETANPVAPLAAGLLSGVLTGSTSMGGVPPVLLLRAWEAQKERFRGDLVAYFCFIYVASALFQVRGGVLDLGALHLAAVVAPGFVAGLVAGGWLFRRLHAAWFHRLALGIVAATSLLAVAGGLLDLLRLG